MHPLVDDLSNLKEGELEAKMQDLGRKYWQARNPDLQHQIGLLLDVYRAELQTRRQKAYEAQFQNRDKNLDKLINVN